MPFFSFSSQHLQVLDLTDNDVGIDGVNALMKALQYNQVIYFSIVIYSFNSVLFQLSTLTTLFLNDTRYLSKVDLKEFNIAPLLRKSKVISLDICVFFKFLSFNVQIFPSTNWRENFCDYLEALKIALIIRTDEVRLVSISSLFIKQILSVYMQQITELDLTGQYFGVAGAQHIADALSVNKVSLLEFLQMICLLRADTRNTAYQS